MFGAVPIIIIRWACHIPFFMTTAAKGYYNGAVSLGNFYDTLPHGHAFLNGLAITGYMSYIVSFWNFFMFAVTGFASVGGSFSILAAVGLVDLVFAVVLMTGVIMESQYLPVSLGSCQHATSWRPNANGKSFFQAARSLSEFLEYREPEAICRGMVETWAMLVAVVGMLFITAFLNIRLGLDEVPIDWSSYVPSRATLLGYWPSGVQWSRCCPRFESLRGWVSRWGSRAPKAYAPVDSEETLVRGDESKDHVSDSESELGEVRKSEDRV